MDHLPSLYEIVHESIEASIVKADDQEGVDCSDGVIGLSFFDVRIVSAYKGKRLDNLDVMEVANKPIRTVT